MFTPYKELDDAADVTPAQASPRSWFGVRPPMFAPDDESEETPPVAGDSTLLSWVMWLHFANSDFFAYKPQGKLLVDTRDGRINNSDAWTKFIQELCMALVFIPVSWLTFPCRLCAIEWLCYDNNYWEEDRVRRHARVSEWRCLLPWLACVGVILCTYTADVRKDLRSDHPVIAYIELVVPFFTFVLITIMEVVRKQRRDVTTFLNFVRYEEQKHPDRCKAKMSVNVKVLDRIHNSIDYHRKSVKAKIAHEILAQFGADVFGMAVGGMQIDDSLRKSLEELLTEARGILRENHKVTAVEDDQCGDLTLHDKRALEQYVQSFDTCMRALDALSDCTPSSGENECHHIELDYMMSVVFLCIAFNRHFKETEKTSSLKSVTALDFQQPLRMLLRALFSLFSSAIPRIYAAKYQANAAWPSEYWICNVVLYMSMLAGFWAYWVFISFFLNALRGLQNNFEALLILQRLVRGHHKLRYIRDFNTIIDRNYGGDAYSQHPIWSFYRIIYAKKYARQMSAVLSKKGFSRKKLVLQKQDSLRRYSVGGQNQEWAPLFQFNLREFAELKLWWELRTFVVAGIMVNRTYMELYLASLIALAVPLLGSTLCAIHSHHLVAGVVVFTWLALVFTACLFGGLQICVKLNGVLKYDSTRLLLARQDLLLNENPEEHMNGKRMATIALLSTLGENINQQVDAVRVFDMVIDSSFRNKLVSLMASGAATVLASFIKKMFNS